MCEYMFYFFNYPGTKRKLQMKEVCVLNACLLIIKLIHSRCREGGAVVDYFLSLYIDRYPTTGIYLSYLLTASFAKL